MQLKHIQMLLLLQRADLEAPANRYLNTSAVSDNLTNSDLIE